MLNGLPVNKPDYYSTALNTALSITSGISLLLNDSDPESSNLTASIVANPSNGTISSFSGSAGTLTYTPNNNYSGIDTFTYKTNDGTADGNTVTVSIAVGGNFGPRTNLEEANRIPSGCRTGFGSLGSNADNAIGDVLKMDVSCLTGGLTYLQPLTPTYSLVYNSDTMPRPIIVVESSLASYSSVPDEIKAQLTFNGVSGTNYSYNTTGLAAGDTLRFALQADATALTTGRCAYTVTLTARFGENSYTRSYTGNYEVVNRSSSTHEFGRGWHLAGLDKLVSVTGGMMLVRSTGDALFFGDNGSGGYYRAIGDETFSTLVKNGDNTYTLTDKHGEKQNFSTAGVLTSNVDRNNNTTTFTYTSGLLTQISDWFGRNTTLSYTSGRLTTVTDWASRAATLAYDTTNGRLTSVTQTDPDGAGSLAAPVWSFSYDSTTHQLTQITNPLN